MYLDRGIIKISLGLRLCLFRLVIRIILVILHRHLDKTLLIIIIRTLIISNQGQARPGLVIEEIHTNNINEDQTNQHFPNNDSEVQQENFQLTTEFPDLT